MPRPPIDLARKIKDILLHTEPLPDYAPELAMGPGTVAGEADTIPSAGGGGTFGVAQRRAQRLRRIREVAAAKHALAGPVQRLTARRAGRTGRGGRDSSTIR